MARSLFLILTFVAIHTFAQVPLSREEMSSISKLKLDTWERVMIFDENLKTWSERFITGTLPTGELVLRGKRFDLKDKIPADTEYGVPTRSMSEVLIPTETPGEYSRRLWRFVFPDGSMGLGGWGSVPLIRVSENFAVTELCAMSKTGEVGVGDYLIIQEGSAQQKYVVQGIFDNDEIAATPYPAREKFSVDTLREVIRVKPNSGYTVDRRLSICEAWSDS